MKRRFYLRRRLRLASEDRREEKLPDQHCENITEAGRTTQHPRTPALHHHYYQTPFPTLNITLTHPSCASSEYIIMVMARSRFGAFGATASWSGVLLLVVAFLTLCQPSLAAENKYVQSTTSDGQTVSLLDNRKPALYTQNFGDCLGSSLINVTRFDAAYYKDNMTVLFHLQGNTAVRNESLMSTRLYRKLLGALS